MQSLGGVERIVRGTDVKYVEGRTPTLMDVDARICGNCYNYC